MGDFRALPPFPQTPFQTSSPVPPFQKNKTWRQEACDDGAQLWKLAIVESPRQQLVRQVTAITRWWAQPFQQVITQVAPAKKIVAEDFSRHIAFPTPPVGQFATTRFSASPTKQSSLIKNITIVETQATTRIVSMQAPKPKRQVK